jgi:hypothetical protein
MNTQKHFKYLSWRGASNFWHEPDHGASILKFFNIQFDLWPCNIRFHFQELTEHVNTILIFTFTFDEVSFGPHTR